VNRIKSNGAFHRASCSHSSPGRTIPDSMPRLCTALTASIYRDNRLKKVKRH
jgi:hypothetical protein